MASSYQHTLERRSLRLASAMQRRVESFSTALTPPGSRPPFTQTFSKDKALDTILTHWKMPATQQWISSMDPQSQLELHNALSQHILEKGLMNATSQPDGFSTSGAAELNRASSMGVNHLAAPNFGMVRNLS